MRFARCNKEFQIFLTENYYALTEGFRSEIRHEVAKTFYQAQGILELPAQAVVDRHRLKEECLVSSLRI